MMLTSLMIEAPWFGRNERLDVDSCCERAVCLFTRHHLLEFETNRVKIYSNSLSS